jgi:hypothetical protein
MVTDFQERARRLRNAVEPVAAGVYFAPEAHAAYAALGFAGSPISQDGVARPDLKGYFTSRGACMGQVPGEVVAAAFGCFNPKVVGHGCGAAKSVQDLRPSGAAVRRASNPVPRPTAHVCVAASGAGRVAPCGDGRAGPLSAFDHHGFVLPCYAECLARCRRRDGSGAERRSMIGSLCCRPLLSPLLSKLV